MDNKTWQEKVGGMVADIKAQVALNEGERRYVELLENLIHEISVVVKDRTEAVNTALSNAMKAMKVAPELYGLGMKARKVGVEQMSLQVSHTESANWSGLYGIEKRQETIRDALTASMAELTALMGDK